MQLRLIELYLDHLDLVTFQGIRAAYRRNGGLEPRCIRAARTYTAGSCMQVLTSLQHHPCFGEPEARAVFHPLREAPSSSVDPRDT